MIVFDERLISMYEGIDIIISIVAMKKLSLWMNSILKEELILGAISQSKSVFARTK